MWAGIILVWVTPSDDEKRNSFQVKAKMIIAVAAAAGAASGSAILRKAPK